MYMYIYVVTKSEVRKRARERAEHATVTFSMGIVVEKVFFEISPAQRCANTPRSSCCSSDSDGGGSTVKSSRENHTQV